MRRFPFLLLATLGTALGQVDPALPATPAGDPAASPAPAPAADPAAAAAATPAAGDPFTALDANRDDRLAREEVPEEYRPHFDQIDADGDGMISRPELQSAMAAATAGAEYETLKDIDYVGQGNPRQALDLLVPKDRATKKRPLVVFIHGGGWLAGSKQDGLGLIRAVTASGEYVGATIGYRLSDEAVWPAQIHDCKAAIRFLRANAAQYGIDPDRIGVVGISAGGHLASLLGTLAGEPVLEGDLGAYPKVSSRVQCVVNFFGPSHLETFFAKDPSPVKREGERMVKQFLDGKSPGLDERARLASPLTWVTQDDPPFFIAHGTADELVSISQSREMNTELKRAGVECHLIEMVGGGHGFASDDLNERIRRFLGNHLLGGKAAISDQAIEVK